jgi:hypothetical protein
MRRKLLLSRLSWFVFEMLVHRGECDGKLRATRALGIASSFLGDKRLRRNSIYPKQKAIKNSRDDLPHYPSCPHMEQASLQDTCPQTPYSSPT